MRFPHATQEAERRKSCGHLHYRYITYSKATNSRNMMWIVLFPPRLPPSADHITFLTGFTFLPWGCLSHCCINDLEPYSSSAASSYWFFFLPSHYKEHTSPVAQKFMQLITWTWHPAFINLCSVVRDAKSFTLFNISAVQRKLHFLDKMCVLVVKWGHADREMLHTKWQYQNIKFRKVKRCDMSSE